MPTHFYSNYGKIEHEPMQPSASQPIGFLYKQIPIPRLSWLSSTIDGFQMRQVFEQRLEEGSRPSCEGEFVFDKQGHRERHREEQEDMVQRQTGCPIG